MKKKIHKYIYDIKNKKIIGEFDKAYKKIKNLWNDQKDFNSLRCLITSGYIVSKNKNKKLLDIGCGYGDYVKFLNKNKICKAEGIDISNYAIKKGRSNNKKIFNGDINTKLNINKKYDYITLFGIFWFMLKNFRQSYKNIKSLSKQSTILFFQINIPRDNNIFNKLIKNDEDLLKFFNKYFKIIKFFKNYKLSDRYIAENQNNQNDVFIICKLK